MTSKSWIILTSLCLWSLAGCTSAPPQPTQVHIDSQPKCPLTLCQLPERPILRVNDDWRMALDTAEDALLSCAAQVQACIELQNRNKLINH